MSCGSGALPGNLADGLSHKPDGRLPLLSMRSVIAFPAAERITAKDRPKTGGDIADYIPSAGHDRS